METSGLNCGAGQISPELRPFASGTIPERLQGKAPQRPPETGESTRLFGFGGEQDNY